MSLSLSDLIDRFRDLEVLVIGEAMLDSYLQGTTGRLCREAPVPIVAVDGRHDAPGGAANTAVNAAALGARVRFLSVVGDDNEGDLLMRSLAGLGIRHGKCPRRIGSPDAGQESSHLLVSAARSVRPGGHRPARPGGRASTARSAHQPHPRL